MRYSNNTAFFLLLALFSFENVAAFSPPSPLLQTKSVRISTASQVTPAWSTTPRTKKSDMTRLSMYNLPPGNNKNELGDIVKGVAGLALVVGFFASPLGGFVLGIFNSFLILSLLLPVAGAIGFSAWQYFNTVSGACPNCGAPARVIKTTSDGESTPSICFSCGAVIQANYDNTGIDNVTGRNTVDGLSGGMGPGGSIFDIFGGPETASFTTTTTTSTTTTSDSTSVIQDDRPKTVSKGDFIDVEIEDSDKPWQ